MDSLLDTDVISQVTKAKPHDGAVRWLRGCQPNSLHLSVVSLAEIRFGIEEMPKGRKRDNFQLWLKNDLPQMFAGRILPIDDRIAEEAGQFMSFIKRAGSKLEFPDAFIAATAFIHGMQIATLNRRHFEKLPVQLEHF